MDVSTNIVKLNGYDAELTRLSAPPEVVVEKLLSGASGAGRIDIVAFGEAHNEFPSRQELASIMKHNKEYFSTFYREATENNQDLINRYMSPDKVVAREITAQLREKVSDLFSHAPGEDQPELRKAFYEALNGMHEAARYDKMKMVCFDADEKLTEEQDAIVNKSDAEKNDIYSKYELHSSFFQAADKPYENHISEDQYKEIIETIRNDPTTDKLTLSMIDDYTTWEDMKAGYEEFTAYMQLSPDVPRNELKQACMDRMDELDEKYRSAEIERDKIRNPEMAKNIFGQAVKDAAQDKQDKVGILLAGKYHILDHPDVPNLIDSVKDLAKKNGKELGIATVDIVALEKNDLEKMGGKGIFLGGKKGADFTILIESRIDAETLESIKVIPYTQSKAASGKFSDIEKSDGQASISKEEDIYQQFLLAKEHPLLSVNPLDIQSTNLASQTSRQC